MGRNTGVHAIHVRRLIARVLAGRLASVALADSLCVYTNAGEFDLTPCDLVV